MYQRTHVVSDWPEAPWDEEGGKLAQIGAIRGQGQLEEAHRQEEPLLYAISDRLLEQVWPGDDA